jgi:UDP-glucose 4-epimerase
VQGTRREIPKEEYTSENTRRLNLQETKELLLSLKEIKEALGAIPA